MKLNVLALALAAAAFTSLGANAQTTVIEDRRDPTVVIEEKPASSVTIEKREGILGTEKKTITKETTGLGDCSSKTVRKEGLTGSTTVKKTECD